MEGLSEEAPYLSEHRLHLNLYSYHNFSRNDDDGAARQTRRVLHTWYLVRVTRYARFYPLFFRSHVKRKRRHGALLSPTGACPPPPGVRHAIGNQKLAIRYY